MYMWIYTKCECDEVSFKVNVYVSSKCCVEGHCGGKFKICVFIALVWCVHI